jgi:hypothetical protein
MWNRVRFLTEKGSKWGGLKIKRSLTDRQHGLVIHRTTPKKPFGEDYIHLATFFEDDMSPFLLRLLYCLGSRLVVSTLKYQ